MCFFLKCIYDVLNLEHHLLATKVTVTKCPESTCMGFFDRHKTISGLSICQPPPGVVVRVEITGMCVTAQHAPSLLGLVGGV